MPWMAILSKICNHNFMKKPLNEIYNEFASTYDDNRGLFDLSEIQLSFYEKLTIKKGELLDLGCGSGEAFSKFFIEKDWKVTGVDFSEKMLQQAHRYVPEMKTVHADIRKVSFDQNQFDAIVAIYSLFHLPCKDHLALFKNIYQWLREGGTALFTYATKQYTGKDEFDGYVSFLGEELFYSHKKPEMLYQDLNSVGFEIISKEYYEIGGETFLWITIKK